MASALIVAEHDGHALGLATAKCVSCAREFADEGIDILVLAAAGASVAESAARLQGVSRVVLVDNPANEFALAAVWAPQIAEIAASYTHVLAPSTTFGKDLMPRLAGLLGVGQISDVMAVEGPYRFKRPIYAGNAIVTVDAEPDLTLVATVRTASYEATPEGGGAATVERRELAVALPTHTRYVGLAAGATEGPDLQGAARVVSGGRGVGSAESFDLIRQLAAELGAAVGASRAAVDAAYVPNDLQVGQTGKIIAPELYIAVGISGAIQHITGIKDARNIVAINSDADAPIFDVADIGVVGDLFEVVPEVIAALQKIRRS